MAIKTLYTVLGVESTALPGDIEDGFLRLKARYPQAKLAADDELRAQFRPIQQAYDTLSNPETRLLYDRKLTSAGMRVAKPEPASAGAGSSWTSTRNILVAGLILLAGSGMWMYHARQQAKEQKAIAERVLRLVEEEKLRKAELDTQAEQRRQSMVDEQQRRREEAERRQLQQEAQHTAQQVDAHMQRSQATADAAQRRAASERMQRERMDEAASRRAELDARRRVEDEKRQLRELCMQKYRRPDC